MKFRKGSGIAAGTIWLPSEKAATRNWPVVACDQYTSQPDYWDAVEAQVGDAPSTYRMIFPEAYLEQDGKEARIARIHKTMEQYLSDGTVVPAVENGFVLVERTVPAGKRIGLVLLVDLEAYDFSAGSSSLIRATEGTITERIPPRVAVRQGAAMELPHIMLLIDDRDKTVIEPLYEDRAMYRKLYDMELMRDGGHLTGWAVEGDEVSRAFSALAGMERQCGGLLFAVGDGNHSLATARQCWLNIRDTLSPEERETHPARYAMAELVNLYSPALLFEPIHRALFHVEPEKLYDGFLAYAEAAGKKAREAEEDAWDMQWIIGGEKRSIRLTEMGDSLPVAVLQDYLDEYIGKHAGTSVDYIHGADVVEQLCGESADTAGILLRGMEKTMLFPFVRANGSLPRKTFSMGEASEKRYYMECRRITR